MYPCSRKFFLIILKVFLSFNALIDIIRGYTPFAHLGLKVCKSPANGGFRGGGYTPLDFKSIHFYTFEKRVHTLRCAGVNVKHVLHFNASKVYFSSK